MLYSSPWSNGPAVTSEMFVKIWESLNAAYVKFGGDSYFPTKITTPTFHEDLKNYSVWGGATMLAGFPFTFIFLMHIVPHIKCWIWIEHISQTTHWILMKFGQGMHNIMKNNRGTFQLNSVHGFRENDHHHLQPIHIFLEIRDVGLSKFFVWRCIRMIITFLQNFSPTQFVFFEILVQEVQL